MKHTILHNIKANIFKNVWDALSNCVILLVLPILSLCGICLTDAHGFWTYILPLITISLAGVADSITRLSDEKLRNPLLSVRILLDIIALILAIIFGIVDNDRKALYAPYIPLILSGLIIGHQIIRRIKFNAKTKPAWYILEKALKLVKKHTKKTP